MITGRVQGVAYRYWTQSEALRRELTGFVRNRWDGNVEAMFCGDENQVESMVSACWNGPPMASVRHIEIKAVDEPAQATSFEIRPVGMAKAVDEPAQATSFEILATV